MEVKNNNNVQRQQEQHMWGSCEKLCSRKICTVCGAVVSGGEVGGGDGGAGWGYSKWIMSKLDSIVTLFVFRKQFPLRGLNKILQILTWKKLQKRFADHVTIMWAETAVKVCVCVSACDKQALFCVHIKHANEDTHIHTQQKGNCESFYGNGPEGWPHSITSVDQGQIFRAKPGWNVFCPFTQIRRKQRLIRRGAIPAERIAGAAGGAAGGTAGGAAGRCCGHVVSPRSFWTVTK